MDIFRHKIIDEPDIANSITTALLAVVEEERRGNVISRTNLSSVLTLLASLSATCFTALFVSPFIEASTRFYKEEAANLASPDGSAPLGPAKYLQHVAKRLEEEGERAETVFATGQDLKASLLHVVESEMITAYTHELLLGLPDFVRAYATNPSQSPSDLSRLYTMLSRVGALDKLNVAWFAYVEVTRQLLNTTEETADWFGRERVARLSWMQQRTTKWSTFCWNTKLG